MKFFAVLIALIPLLSFSSYAQDPVFTQVRNNPLFLNPAYAGVTGARLICIHKRQWPYVPGEFNTFLLSFDMNDCSPPRLTNRDSKVSFGFGGIFISDKEGEGILTATILQLIGNIYFETRNWDLCIAIQPGGQWLSLNWDRFVFSDQLDPTLGNVKLSNAKMPDTDNVPFRYDLGAGILSLIDIGGHENILEIGVNFQHIMEPPQAFYFADGAHLPMRTSFHGGLKIKVKRKPILFVYPYLKYEFQDNGIGIFNASFSEFDIGFYMLKDWRAGLNYQSNFNFNKGNIKMISGIFGYDFSGEIVKGIVEMPLSLYISFGIPILPPKKEMYYLNTMELSMRLALGNCSKNDKCPDF